MSRTITAGILAAGLVVAGGSVAGATGEALPGQNPAPPTPTTLEVHMDSGDAITMRGGNHRMIGALLRLRAGMREGKSEVLLRSDPTAIFVAPDAVEWVEVTVG